MGLVTKLTARVEFLENIGRRREEQFAQLEQLSLQRQEGHLATIKALEEEVDYLKSTVAKLESKGTQCSRALKDDFLPTVTRSADCEHLLKPSNCSSDRECKVVSSGSCMCDGILSASAGQLSPGSASSPILSKNEIHQSVVDESEADSRLRQSALPKTCAALVLR